MHRHRTTARRNAAANTERTSLGASDADTCAVLIEEGTATLTKLLVRRMLPQAESGNYPSGYERRGSLFQTDPQERTKPNEASSDDAPSTHAYTHTQTQTYTDTDTKTDAHPERRSMIEEGGSRKKSSREVKGDRCQKEEVTLDHHWTS